ncbi:MAG: DUF424 family protein [Candidatus Nezhaarchaeota archaeon]|nr:DUF424 family protein [Candidatus Nezhaarchaeota archaeon]
MSSDDQVEVYVKIHRHGGDVVVAVCDAELLGKTFAEGAVKIEVSEKFYGGEKMSLKEAMKIAKKATIANFLGENCVKYAIKRKLIHKDAVTVVASIPHAQLIKIT